MELDELSLVNPNGLLSQYFDFINIWTTLHFLFRTLSLVEQYLLRANAYSWSIRLFQGPTEDIVRGTEEMGKGIIIIISLDCIISKSRSIIPVGSTQYRYDCFSFRKQDWRSHLTTSSGLHFASTERQRILILNRSTAIQIHDLPYRAIIKVSALLSFLKGGSALTKEPQLC